MKKIYLLLLCAVQAGLAVSCSDDDELEKSLMDIDFKADVQNVSVGDPVNFTDLSIGEVSKWNWTFEGGTPPTSTLQNPTVTYDDPGTYKVSLEVSNADNSLVLDREAFIEVSASAVAADFEASKTNAIQGENIVFTDLSTGSPNSWEWEFISSDGTTVTSSDQNPIISFEEPGIYSVKMTASNADNSDQAVKADFLTIVDVTSVQADFAANTTATFTGGTVQFTDLSVGTATEWNWTIEGPATITSAEQNPEISFDTPGKYDVTLVASNDSKSSTETKESHIIVVPGGELAAFYSFNGNELDAGPNALNPTAVGSGVTFEDGRDGQVGVFGGEGGLMVTDNEFFNFGTSNYSVSLWIKTDNTSKMMVWQESGANGAKDNQSWLRIGDNTSDRLIRFAIEDPTGGKILNIGEAEVPLGVSDNQWHHVVTVRDGVTTRVYVDGEMVKEDSAPDLKHVSNEQNFKIGVQEQEGNFHSFFKGLLDDLVIYNRALTAEEVVELYNL
ncbi:PKD domain-containing protein [uncultured Salegentibacter sp.]|uniref:LamG domain-containing protein n=1 Tax=uncultured Salegentibacter sp. TaxID=259320 RepID=UPI002598B508|nr:PKD domain-containing protein [uncultured Salegentibacter sp.]